MLHTNLHNYRFCQSDEPLKMRSRNSDNRASNLIHGSLNSRHTQLQSYIALTCILCWLRIAYPRCSPQQRRLIMIILSFMRITPASKLAYLNTYCADNDALMHAGECILLFSSSIDRSFTFGEIIEVLFVISIDLLEVPNHVIRHKL